MAGKILYRLRATRGSHFIVFMGLPGGSSGKNLSCRTQVQSLGWEIPAGSGAQPTPVVNSLPGIPWMEKGLAGVHGVARRTRLGGPLTVYCHPNN